MIHRKLVEMAPPIRASDRLLDQTVSWSSEKKPVSLRQFLVSRAPAVAKALELKEPIVGEPVKRIEELDENELREAVCARLREGTEDLSLGIIGKGEFTINDLISEVKSNTSLGWRLVSAAKRDIALVEQLAETGKIRLEADLSVRLPELDF